MVIMITIERKDNEVILKCYREKFADEGWEDDDILAERIKNILEIIRKSGVREFTNERRVCDYGTDAIAIDLKELLQIG